MNTPLRILWNKKWPLVICAGILLGLSYPPFPFPFLQIPALILLFRLSDLTETNREAAYWSYFAFVIWNVIVTYWLMMATFWGGVAAILANSAVMTIPFVLQRLVQKRLNVPAYIAIFQSAFWVSYEYLHHHWDLAWPWLALGNAWSNVPLLVQYISFTGYLGISFWILLTSSLAYQAISKNGRGTALAAIFAAFFFPAVSLVQYAAPDIQPSRKIDVLVVQPNIDSYQYLGGYDNPSQMLKMELKLSDSLRTSQTRAIFWPENAVEPYISNTSTNNVYAERVKKTIEDSAKSWGVPIIAGSTYYRFYKDGNAPTLVRHNGSAEPFLYYNAAFSFYPNGSFSVYKKHNLVPIVERIPFVQFLARHNYFGIKWAQQPWYAKGYDFDQFNVASTKTPALVCYDSVFPGWVRGFVTRGAGFISIITNDGWWGDTSGHKQHFAYARLRAIELRRWIVRSANNGISGIIDPNGMVKVKTKYWERTGFNYKIGVIKPLTFYAKYGPWFSYLCIGFSVVGIITLLFLRWFRRL